MNEQNLAKLRELLLTEFNEAELAALCQDIGLNYARLPGVGIYGKTREIIQVARTRQMMRALAARVRELRPGAYQAAGIIATDATTHGPAPRATRVPARLPATPAATVKTIPPVTQTKTPSLAGIVMVAAIIGGLLLIVVMLNSVLPMPEASPSVATVTVTVTIAIPTVTDTPLPAATNTAVVVATASAPATKTSAATMTPEAIAQAVTPTATRMNTPTPTPIPTATPVRIPTKTSLPESTLTISESHSAAQTIRALNAQLIVFFSGRIAAEALQRYWSGEAYRVVLNFIYNIMLRRLGVNLALNEPADVTMRYVRIPAVVAAADDTAQVKAREFWRYTNPRTNHTICETRDYTYNLAKVAGQYQVQSFDGALVDTGCVD